MRVFRNLQALPKFKNAVITIGSFDGIHAGHQQLLSRINHTARSIEGESILITFHPHPRLVLLGEKANLKLITTIDEKIELLRKYGVDNLVIVPFTKNFSAQSPDEYICDFLVAKFQPKVIVIGYDHKFGKNRAGNIDYLRKYEATHDFEIMEIQKHEIADIAVSSTKVRQAIIAGKVDIANDLLKHPYTLRGEVVYGKQLGTKIGFPTANIKVDSPHKIVPPQGIYAVFVQVHQVIYKGMLYIGDRPTINGVGQSIEVNIFDFDKNIYGDSIEIVFVKWIRGDKKLASLEELIAHLQKDKETALRILKELDEKVGEI